MGKLREQLQALGPGILIACAAIGGSHLVWSTRAGAEYGWALLGLILFANFLKFPFFYFGQHYTAVTGESLLSGYQRLGSFYLYAFIAINLFTGSINIAAVGMLTAALSLPFLGGLNLELTHLSILFFIVLSSTLFFGHYALLDRLSKGIILILSLCTLIAVLLAFSNANLNNVQVLSLATNEVPADPFTLASLAFIISLLGWMPAPIDLSTWSSLWMQSRQEQTGHRASPKEVAIDFSIGYGITTLLACLFLALGALTLYGTGAELAQSGIEFSAQLIELYTESIGAWTQPIIIVAAFSTMLSTTLTCLDGYPRSTATCTLLLQSKVSPEKEQSKKRYLFMLGFFTLSASTLLLFFVKNLMALLSFAAVVAFLTSPVLAWMNLKVMTGATIPKAQQPATWIKFTSYLGIAFFTLLSLAYLYQKLSA
tara:strand:- start:517 stop:1797 length:1281 start_codon:yes stop_codon:yes gene_type:complete